MKNKRWQLFVLFTVVLVEPVALTIIIPFIYSMTKSFGIAEDERDVGFYVGMLVGSFSFCQFLSSTFWGSLSNRIGRKPVILWGLLCNCITSLMFGFSKNYTFALVVRSISGLMNGNIAVAKCVLGETSETAEEQSFGFSLFGFAFGLGSIVAPTLGGLLSHPAENFPDVFGGSEFFITFPYLLPCMISSSVAFFGFLSGYFYLEESLKLKHQEDAVEVEGNDESTSLLANKKSDEAYMSYDTLPADKEAEVILDPNYSWRAAPPVIFAYALLATTNIVFQEIYSIWAQEKISYGGLGWREKEVGLSLMISGVFLLFTQSVLYPKLEAKFGLLSLFRIARLLECPVLFLTGFISVFHENGYVVWSLTIFHHIFRIISAVCSFTPIMIMVNNSADAKTLGMVNGIAQAVASLVRGIGPLLGGLIWAFSLKSDLGYPFNYHFVFILMSALSFLTWLESYLILPETQKSHINIGSHLALE